MKLCSVPGCGVSVTDAQADISQKLFGNIFCLDHEKTARKEADQAASAFTIDTSPYIKCGFRIENGQAVKIIGQAELTVDIAKVAAGKPKKECVQIGGYEYELGQNPDVDKEIKWLFAMIPKKSEGSSEKKDAHVVETPKGEEPAPQPELDLPTNVLTALKNHVWTMDKGAAAKVIDGKVTTIDLSKIEQRGKAARVDGAVYEFGKNNIVDAELKSLFNEIAKPVTRIRDVELNPESIIKYLCPDATFEEAVLFLQVCKHRNLNPFVPGEVFLVKYDKASPAATVVGKYAFTKKADAHKDFEGYTAGIIVRNIDGEIEERGGTFYLPAGRDTKKDDVFEVLLGGWAKVKRKGREDFTEKVSLQECIKLNREGQPVRGWRDQPATMIRKSALVRALREAFPAELGGLYEESEIMKIEEVRA